MLVIFSGGEFLLNTVLYRNSGKKRKSFSCVHVLQKSEISNFHVVVVQRRQRNMYKKSVMNVQSCCITKYNVTY